MIFVDRKSVPIPEFFSSEEYKEKTQILKNFYHRVDRYQERFINYKLPFNVINDIQNLFYSKCAYCESEVTGVNMAVPKMKGNYIPFNGVDHFRPQNNTKDFFTNKTNLEHYWWLTYEWNNLYYCCKECKRNKSTWFAIEGKRVATETPYNDILEIENNLIIDPCNDAINPHLEINIVTGKYFSKTKKGETTIEILNLNRKDLVLNRINAVKEEQKLFQIREKPNKKNQISELAIYEYWNSIFLSNNLQNYLTTRREVFFQHLENNPDLEKIFGNHIPNYFKWLKENKKIKETSRNKKETSKKTATKPIEKPSISLKNIHLEKIELINYKCFDNLKIDFLDSTDNANREPWLVFLGENGVGKSSLLKAIAIALMGQKNIDKLNLKPSRHLQYGKRVGYVRVYGKNGEFYEVKFTKNKITSNSKESSSYIIGYGSTRLLPKGNLVPETDVKYVKIKNLFDYSVALEDAKSWLLDVSTKMFDQVAISLKDLLLLDNEDIIKRNKNKNELSINYTKNGNHIDVSDLSDGYKTIFAITVDLIKTLSKDNLAFETAEGIILIDEIGTHLHPRWKMEVVSRLRKTFPKLQFIATTHEPLCLRGLGENEVVVLKKDNDDEIIAVTDLPNPNEFRVDQLLTSEYFGLNSTMDFETEDLFKEYYDLIAKEDNEITDEEKKRRDELGQSLPNKKHLGDDIRDELVYYVIDQLLAKQVNDKGYKIIDKTIKKEALDRVKSIWDYIEKTNNNI